MASGIDGDGQQHKSAGILEGDVKGASSYEGVTDIVPFLQHLSEKVNGEVMLPHSVATAAALASSAVMPAGALGVVGSGGAGASAPVSGAPANPAAGVGGVEGADRVRLDAERQILLTMLLAHMCSEHDATPRTFVEQVLRLYEAKVLDSIQFLFDLGFIPPIALPFHNPVNRAAIVEAVRRQMNKVGEGEPLLLGAWPQGASAAAAAAAAAGGDKGENKNASAAEGLAEERGAVASLGLRVLSTSRYLRDFEEEGLIARGSFGDVYRTRHRLDGKRYAIKKVVFRGIGVSHPHAQAVMREVQCLAQLDHKNIVRYHTSWLESGWVESGMGYGQPAGRSNTAPVQWLGGIDRSSAGGGDALMPKRLHAHRFAGTKDKMRAGDSTSESGSGWGWGGESENGKALGLGRLQGRVGRSGPFLRVSRAEEPRRSASPQILSPIASHFPPSKANARERGLSHWSVEDLDSETSRWSEVSSSVGGDWNHDAGKQSRGGEESNVPAKPSRRSHGFSALRKHRADHGRLPSIDVDDLVSFGKSSPAGGENSVDQSVDDVREEPSDDWRAWDAASSTDTFDQDPHRTGGARRRSAGRRWAQHRSVLPEHGFVYPVTLYIQMNLCPSDTLQDWIRKRNARLSADAETTGKGVLYEGRARVLQDCRAAVAEASGRPSEDVPEPVRCEDAREVVPVLHPPPLLAEQIEGVDKFRHATPTTSPRTDPVTSRSSGASDESSSDDSSSSVGSGADGCAGLAGGTLCPPPTREIGPEGLCGSREKRDLSFATAADRPENSTSPRAGSSSVRSESSGCCASCEGAEGAGRVDLHEALDRFRQVAEGVAHIHSKGIIHRDIKPENVFLGEDDCLKIGDFGLSRTESALAAGAAVDDIPRSSIPVAAAVNDCHLEAAIVPRRTHSECHTSGVGTASYASPEQLQGRQYGVRSDLFSLGLVLLELCCCFTTTHERAEAFRSMRHPHGSAPAHLATRSPAVAHLAELLCRTVPKLRPSAAEVLEKLDDLDGTCGCAGCPGLSRSQGRGARAPSFRNASSVRVGYDSEDAGDLRLREELAAKTRKVEEQEALIGQLQQKLHELSANPSPAVGPAQPANGETDGCAFDMESLKLGLAAVRDSPTARRGDRTDSDEFSDVLEAPAGVQLV